MTRRIYGTSSRSKDSVLDVIVGGTYSITAKQATETLDIVSKDDFNKADGVVTMIGGSIPSIVLPNGISLADTYAKLTPKDISLNNPFTQLGPNVTVEFLISNYDLEAVYSLSATQGSVIRNRDTVSFTMPNSGPGIFTIDGREITIPSIVSGITKPSITNIANSSAIDKEASFIIETSNFALAQGLSDVFYGIQYQFSLDANFTNIFKTLDVTNVLSNNITVPADTLNYSTTYHVRVRHKGYSYGWSNWSDGYQITTKSDEVIIPVVAINYTVPDTWRVYTPAIKESPATYYGPYAGEALNGHERWQDYGEKNGVDVGLMPAAGWSNKRIAISNLGNTRTQRVNITGRFFCGVWDTANGYIYKETIDNSVSGASLIASANSGHVPDWNIYDFNVNTTYDIPPDSQIVLRFYTYSPYNGDYKYNRYLAGFKGVNVTHNAWI